MRNLGKIVAISMAVAILVLAIVGSVALSDKNVVREKVSGVMLLMSYLARQLNRWEGKLEHHLSIRKRVTC